jgi:hypothetical protein
MKKLILITLFFALAKISYAQITRDQAKFNFLEFSLGGGIPVIDNKAFDNWTETNYHRKLSNHSEGTISMYFVGSNYDAGFEGVGSSEDYTTITFYLGRRLTPAKSPISSFLNIGIGFFANDVYDLSPIHYKRSADEIGQEMYLRYSTTFLSLQSRNYIHNLSFNISRNHKLNFQSGFYAAINFRPWGSTWEYGYDKKVTVQNYDEDGDEYDTHDIKFTGHKVYDVPALASHFFDAGVFLSITYSTIKKGGYYKK